jgi:hypothetical protein
VPVVAGFPVGWRPTEQPGQCLAELGASAGVFDTFVPHNQFRQYERISEEDALAPLPQLVHHESSSGTIPKPAMGLDKA